MSAGHRRLVLPVTMALVIVSVASCGDSSSSNSSTPSFDASAFEASSSDSASIDGSTDATTSCVPDATCPPTADVDATVASVVDVSKVPITPGRTCAESPAFSVTALTATSATVAAAPSAGCLVAGDEVLLVNLQGADASIANVGNWELLNVATVAGASITFTAPKTRAYGATTDDAIGVGATDQKVVLVRVAHFGTLTVGASGKLTTAAWDGAKGGVIAVRATKLVVAGSITAAGLGYRNGRWSRDDPSCTETLATESGESIGGPPAVTTDNRNGAPGGLGGPLDAHSFLNNSPINSGAGHANAGDVGVNGDGRVVGAPGIAYGAADASRLTMGSGASGSITCDAIAVGPILVDVPQPLAGGIVALFAKTLTVSAGGSISAAALTATRDVSAAGGYVFVKGTTLDVGMNLVTAAGAVAPSGSPPTVGDVVRSSDGYVVLDAANVSGTTTPAAHQL